MLDRLISLFRSKQVENTNSSAVDAAVVEYASAGGYVAADRAMLLSLGRSPIGLIHDCSVSAILALPVTDEVLGLSILKALNEYLPDYQLPEDHKQRRQAMLKAMGYRSERQLQQQTLYCSIAQTEKGTEFAPSHNGGTSGDSKGFQRIKPSVLVPAEGEAADLGQAFRATLNASSTIYERPSYL